MGPTSLRHALRIAWRAPFLTAVVLLILAGGIAITTAAFGLVNAVWLTPLPYPDSSRLVVVNQVHPRLGFEFFVTPATCAAWRESGRWAEGMGAFSERAFALGRPGVRAERVRGASVSPALLRLLGASTVIGRPLVTRDAVAGAPPVALISERFWRRHYSGSPSGVGGHVRLDGVDTTIVGVLPYSFRLFNSGFDVFVPLADAPFDRDRSLIVVARLASGVSHEAAARQLASFDSAGSAAARAEDPEWTPIVRPLDAVVWGEARPAFLLLLTAACLFLALISANVSNLLLARAEERRHEFAVRLTIGAGRFAIVRQLITEGLLLAVTSGILAFVLCVCLHRLLVANVPEMAGLKIDARVLGFASLASILMGIVFGSVPALSVMARDAQGSLRSDAASSDQRRRTGRILAVAQVAAATALLICCGLLVRAAFGIRATDPGFAADRLLTASISLPGTAYASPERRIAFYRSVIARVAAMPGVVDVGLGSALPLDAEVGTMKLEIEGRASFAEAIRASRNTISAGYLRALGLQVRAGESLRDEDATSVLVNRAMARSLWKDEALAVGARVRIEDGPWRRVGGVVTDARQVLTVPAAPQIYLPLHVETPTVLSLVVRTTADPMTLAPAVAAAVRDLDIDVPVSNVRSMTTIIDGYVPAPFLAAFVVLSAIAVFFSALGLYAVIAFQVARRTREFGVRMALGADARRILCLIVSEGMRLTVAGLVLGGGAGLGLARLLAHSVFPVEIVDPVVGATVCGVLTAVSVAACVLPAWRATALAPAVALRRE